MKKFICINNNVLASGRPHPSFVLGQIATFYEGRDAFSNSVMTFESNKNRLNYNPKSFVPYNGNAKYSDIPYAQRYLKNTNSLKEEIAKKLFVVLLPSYPLKSRGKTVRYVGKNPGDPENEFRFITHPEDGGKRSAKYSNARLATQHEINTSPWGVNYNKGRLTQESQLINNSNNHNYEQNEERATDAPDRRGKRTGTSISSSCTRQVATGIRYFGNPTEAKCRKRNVGTVKVRFRSISV